jgi:hypothetical protein
MRKSSLKTEGQKCTLAILANTLDAGRFCIPGVAEHHVNHGAV